MSRRLKSFWNRMTGRTRPAPQPAVQPERAILVGGYVTIAQAWRVVAVNGDDITLSIRSTANDEWREVIYPRGLLKACNGVSSSDLGGRIRVVPPATPPDPE